MSPYFNPEYIDTLNDALGRLRQVKACIESLKCVSFKQGLMQPEHLDRNVARGIITEEMARRIKETIASDRDFFRLEQLEQAIDETIDRINGELGDMFAEK